MWSKEWKEAAEDSESNQLLLHIDTEDDSMSFSKTGVIINGKEGEADGDTAKSKYGSIVRLSPGRCNADEYDGSRDPASDGTMEQLSVWWKKKKQRIFRKKTLYMRFPILQWLPKYSIRKDLLADFIAGLTIAITVIPQGLAYATVAGLPPEYGLYSSYMGCFIYVLLGSTKVITIGPTALLGLVTHDAAVSMGPEAAILLAFLSGLICLLLGLLNLGFLVEFIAAPVIAGFTTAAAFTIGTSQVKSLLGLKFEAEGFVNTWAAVFEHIGETSLWDAVMGFSCIICLLLLRLLDRIKIGDKEHPTLFQRFINGSLWFIATSRNAIIIIIAMVIAVFLCSPDDDPSTYPFYVTGNVTAGLPPFQLPPFSIQNGNETLNFGEICNNLGSALFIMPLVTILESVSIAKSFAKGAKVDASQEMIAIGVSNIMGSFVSSYSVTGSFSRTAVNYASGVHTALGGIFTGSIVLLAITVLTPYFYYIPKSSLAAVIICAVIFMVEVHLMKLVWRSRKIDLIPLLVTFLCCVFISLEIGILIGTAVNLAMLLYATARPRIKLYKMNGPATEYLMVTPDRSLVFTSMDYFMSTVRKAAALHPKIPVVIDLSYVSIADFTTAYGVNNLTEDLHKRDHAVVLTRAQPRVLTVLLGVEPDVHVHREGMDLDKLLRDIVSPPEISIAPSITPPLEEELDKGIDGPYTEDD